MTIYHIPVRDYYWPAGSITVQCPLRDLDTTCDSPIIRPLAGVNKGEPRFVDKITDLVDQGPSQTYETEAHGVLVPTDSILKRIPVWVPFRQQPAQQCVNPPSKHEKKSSVSAAAESVLVADLNTSSRLQARLDRICWVPSHEAPDGRICTVIASQLTVGRKKMSHVLVQSIESPGSAKFVLLTTQELAGFSEIDENRKKQLFEVQMMMVLRQKRSLSPSLKNALRLVLVSQPRAASKRLLWDCLDEDMAVPRCSGSETSEGSFWEDVDSDLESACDSPPSSVTTRVTTVSDTSDLPLLGIPLGIFYANHCCVLQVPCKCACTLLWPTLDDPYPQHRHILDHECYSGCLHEDHCVFAEHSPTLCIMTSSRHRHCLVRPQAGIASVSSLDTTIECSQGEATEKSSQMSSSSIEQLGTPSALDETPISETVSCQELADDLPDILDLRNTTWMPYDSLMYPAAPSPRGRSPAECSIFNIDGDFASDLGADMAPTQGFAKQPNAGRGSQVAIHDCQTPEPPDLCF